MCHLGVWMNPKGKQMNFIALKFRKRSIFVIDSDLKDSTFTAV